MLLVVVGALAVQVAYWLVLRSGFSRVPRRVASRPAPAMSVIVAARDEQDQLPRLLQALAAQTHPRFEVIVVDDGSKDGTPDILESSTAHLPSLRVLRTDGAGKKRALERGIAAASSNLLAFTDADCEPPRTWLTTLAAAHASSADDCVLIGYSPFRCSGSLVERLASYETFVTGFLTAAAAGLGRPYMAVGRNLSYPRTVFDRVEGFEPIMHSLSGDDDLFVQEVVRRDAAEVRALLDPRSFVPTDAPTSWRAWLRQKRRHASGGRFYVLSARIHLAAFHGSNLLVWLAPVVLGWAGVGLLAAKILIQFTALLGPARRMGEIRQMSWQPVLELGYLLYNVVVAPLGLMKIPERW